MHKSTQSSRKTVFEKMSIYYAKGYTICQHVHTCIRVYINAETRTYLYTHTYIYAYILSK